MARYTHECTVYINMTEAPLCYDAKQNGNKAFY